MQYEWIAGIFVISCIAFLIVGIVTLAKKQWFLAWLRGTLGFLCLLVAVGFGLLSINIFSYQNLVSETPVATISFERNKSQEFNARVVLPQGDERLFRVTGDLWQVDAKMIKWEGVFSALGFQPGYKLDRLQGRYIALEDEREIQQMGISLISDLITF